MEYEKVSLEQLISSVQEYAVTSYELLKLKTIEKSVSVFSSLISGSLLAVALFMFIALFNIGVALWLGDLLGKVYYGFFCVAGFYALVGAVFYFLMFDKLKNRISDSIISIIPD